MQDGTAAPAPASPVALVGAGAVGSTLARSLAENDRKIEAVLSRDGEKARALAERVEAPVSGAMSEALPSAVRLVLVCVPDDAIEEVAEGLAARNHPWADTIVAHTSGAKRAAALDPLARQGAATMSFHPVQTFTAETLPEAMEGIVVGLEGEDRAVSAGIVLAETLGAHPVRLTPDDKARLHCAAALASNGLVALLAVVEEVFGTSEGDASLGSAADLVGPLVEHTWANLRQEGPEEALTGPVMRGDVGTVRAHLEALEDETPHLVPVYTALSTEMVRVAVRGGHLSTERAETLLTTLRTAAGAGSDSEGSPEHSR